jgi:serine phosphatase RsbU (regulator of sigma subunit)
VNPDDADRSSNKPMRILQNVRKLWRTIRWKVLIIFAFFSVISTFLITCFSIAVVNVVIRRESTYLIEERIKGIIDTCQRLTPALVQRVQGCHAPAVNSPPFADYPGAVWPGGQTLVAVLPKGVAEEGRPRWLESDSFAGVVVDRGNLEIQSFSSGERQGCSVRVLLRVPLSESLAERLSSAADLQISSRKPKLLRRFHAHEEIRHVIEANLLPGSRRPLSVVVTARNWQTGLFEDWEVCQVRPSYARTLADLSHVGMRTVRLSTRIVAVIDGLSHAASQVGKGDFSVRVAVPEQDQLGMLASSFNEMTRDLEVLRQQEKQNAVLERDIALAHEVQQYLYPRVTPALSGANVWGVTTPARTVSGDLYDFLPFSATGVGLLCADVSGKGVSAALMMAHLQALAHGRLLPLNDDHRPAPDVFVTALNRGIQGRFGNNRYLTMFYGEFNPQSKILRYINAGHCPPILVSKAGEATKLTGGDMPVGLFPDIRYNELRVTLPRGCALVVYTDGLTDALNYQGEEFGEERLIRCCNSLPQGASAEAICTLLSKRVVEWAAGVEQFDDTTILVLSVE